MGYLLRNLRTGKVSPRGFCQSATVLAVMKEVEERLMASLRSMAALRSVSLSITWSRLLFLTHFSRTFVMVRHCCELGLEIERRWDFRREKKFWGLKIIKGEFGFWGFDGAKG